MFHQIIIIKIFSLAHQTNENYKIPVYSLFNILSISKKKQLRLYIRMNLKLMKPT